jgi:hypothetical protein
VANSTSYHIFVSSDSNFVNIVFDTVIVGNLSTSWIPLGLPFGAKLYAKINGLNNCGVGPSSTRISFTTVSLPNAPTNLIRLAKTATSVTLKWTDNATNETGFRVERSTGNDSTFQEISTNLGSNTTIFVSPNLVDGTTYYYRVRAANAIGFSNYSNVLEVVFTTGINENSAFNSINIYPNPSEDIFNIELQDDYLGETKITLVDELGRIVYTESINKTKGILSSRIDLSNKSNGVYFLKINSDKKTTTKRIVKIN